MMNQKDLRAKEGMRVRLVSMTDDPNPITPGTEGIIKFVDDLGVIHVKWDNGRTLGLIPGIDHYELIPNENKMFEDVSSSSAVKTAIKKTPSNVNKSMPKPTKVSSSTSASLKSSGVKTNQVSKNFKSANIKDVKVEQKDQIKGGKADNLSIKDLAKKHKVSIDTIKKEIKIGVQIEKEHVGNDIAKAKEIAMDHISEFVDYYSNKRYGVLASEKGLKKSEKKKKEKIKTETTTAAGGASTGAYTGNAWGSVIKNKKATKPNHIEEHTTTRNTDKTYDISGIEFADLDHDGWYFDDVSFWKDGEIVDPLSKKKDIISGKNFWGPFHSTGVGNKTLKKKDLFRIVNNKLNEYQITKNKKLNSVKNNFTPPPIEEEELDETTTFGSVWGFNGPPIGPAFAAKKGQWKTAKKPIWKGGVIVQKDTNEGILNPINETEPINEVNKVKYNPKGKYVKIAKKCTKFPYCNQGAIDNPLKISNTVNRLSTYVERLDDETIKNIHEISKEIGKPFIEIYRIVLNNVNEGLFDVFKEKKYVDNETANSILKGIEHGEVTDVQKLPMIPIMVSYSFKLAGHKILVLADYSSSWTAHESKIIIDGEALDVDPNLIRKIVKALKEKKYQGTKTAKINKKI